VYSSSVDDLYKNKCNNEMWDSYVRDECKCKRESKYIRLICSQEAE
jgi:hypothetical protein